MLILIHEGLYKNICYILCSVYYVISGIIFNGIYVFKIVWLLYNNLLLYSNYCITVYIMLINILYQSTYYRAVGCHILKSLRKLATYKSCQLKIVFRTHTRAYMKYFTMTYSFVSQGIVVKKKKQPTWFLLNSLHCIIWHLCS